MIYSHNKIKARLIEVPGLNKYDGLIWFFCSLNGFNANSLDLLCVHIIIILLAGMRRTKSFF